jgi:hypothetical protein
LTDINNLALFLLQIKILLEFSLVESEYDKKSGKISSELGLHKICLKIYY